MVPTLTPDRHGKTHNGNRTACKACGQKGLEWVHISTGWVYAPWGSNDTVPAGERTPVDLSGTVHPLRPETCEEKLAQNGQAPIAAPTPSAAAPVDLTAVNDRLDILDKNGETLRNAMNMQSETIANIARDVASKGSTYDPSPLVDAIANIDAKVDAIARTKPVTIEIKPIKGPVVAMGSQHPHFASALAMLQAIGQDGVLALHGPAGSRKTHVVGELGKALGLESEVQSFGLGTTKGDVVGFRDAHGVYAESQLFRAFTGIANGVQGKGRLFAGDEFDSVLPQTATIANAAFANDRYGFPHGMFPRAAENLNMVLMNTTGRGPDALYNDRQPLGGATIDRFVFLPWPTEWAAIAASVGLAVSKSDDGQWFPNPQAPRAVSEYADWADYVYRVCQIVVDRGIRASIGGRALRIGAKLLAAGIHTNYQTPASDGLVEYSTIWAHMSEQDADTVKANL